MKIFLPHPDISQEPSTSLTEPVSAGGSALTVINNAGLSANNYIIMGKIGEEKSELRQISSITGHLAMAVDTIDFDHPVDTPITYMPFNQIRIYMGDWSGRYATGTISISKSQDTALSSGKSTVTGSGTSWVVAGISTSHWLYVRDKWYQISSVTNATSLILTDTYEDEDIAGETYALVEFSYAATETIDVDSENTIYEDTDGLEEDYYISMYYNLQTSVAAAYSYPVGGTTKTGFLPDTLKVLRDSIYAEVDPNKEFLTDDLIDGWANDAGRDIRDEKAEWNFTKTETSITLVDNQAAYKLPDDLEVLGRVVYEKDDGTEHTYTQLRLVGEA